MLATLTTESRDETGNVRAINITETSSRNHCCHGKTISVTYSECVSVALVTQHAMRMRRIVICGPSGSTIFFHIISQTYDFRKKKAIERKMLFIFC